MHSSWGNKQLNLVALIAYVYKSLIYHKKCSHGVKLTLLTLTTIVKVFHFEVWISLYFIQKNINIYDAKQRVLIRKHVSRCLYWCWTTIIDVDIVFHERCQSFKVRAMHRPADLSKIPVASAAVRSDAIIVFSIVTNVVLQSSLQ